MKQAEEEQDNFDISLEPKLEEKLEELVSELQGYRQGIKCATIYGSKYGTLDNLMHAMEKYPFEDKDIRTERLQEIVSFARSGFYNEKEYLKPIIESYTGSLVRV